MKSFALFAVLSLVPLALVSREGYAHPPVDDPSLTIYHSLPIDPKSPKIETFEELTPNHYKAEVSFTILPMTSCQDQYAGVHQTRGKNNYEVVYATTWNARCKQFAHPRDVRHVFFFKTVPAYRVENGVAKEQLESSADFVTLNGHRYIVESKNKTLTISPF